MLYLITIVSYRQGNTIFIPSNSKQGGKDKDGSNGDARCERSLDTKNKKGGEQALSTTSFRYGISCAD